MGVNRHPLPIAVVNLPIVGVIFQIEVSGSSENLSLSSRRFNLDVFEVSMFQPTVAFPPLSSRIDLWACLTSVVILTRKRKGNRFIGLKPPVICGLLR